MTDASPAVREVLAMPEAQRQYALGELVIAEFRAALRIDDDADFPLHTGFFDLGMTSLRLVEVRQRLTRLLGKEVRTETLFEHPTMASLLEHLAEAVLTGLSSPHRASAPPTKPAQLEELLERLYR